MFVFKKVLLDSRTSRKKKLLQETLTERFLTTI